MRPASRGKIWVAARKSYLQTTKRRFLRNSNICSNAFYYTEQGRLVEDSASKIPTQKAQSPIHSHIAFLSIFLRRTAPITAVHFLHSISKRPREKRKWLSWTPSLCVLLRFSVTLMAPKVTSADADPPGSPAPRRLRLDVLSLSAKILGTPPPRLIWSPGSASPSSDI